MKQYEKLLAEIERRKKVLTILGEGCIVGQRNAAEYKLLCELEEFAKGLTSEVTSEATSEINELDRAAVEYFKEALNTGNDSKLEWFKAGANWRKQQMINKGAEWLRKCLDNGMWVDQFLSEKDKEAIVLTYKENMEEEFKL